MNNADMYDDGDDDDHNDDDEDEINEHLTPPSLPPRGPRRLVNHNHATVTTPSSSSGLKSFQRWPQPH